MNKSDSLRFGMVQGRLVRSPPGQLQWFPQKDWESEFFIAQAIGIDYIELIAERKHNPLNPIWSEKGIARIKELAIVNGLTLHAFCNDFIVDNSLITGLETLQQNLQLIACGAKLGCEKYILPLFEQSELTPENFQEYLKPLRTIADCAAEFGITVCLETNLNGSELKCVLAEVNHSAIGVVYDTGNRVAFGHDLPRDIRLLGDEIQHVHIKDKNNANENVVLGTGLVNFSHVFDALADINYQGPFTFETNRGHNPSRTAAFNIQLVKYFHAESASR